MVHALDVWAYKLIVAVWGQFWPVAAAISGLALLERVFPLERKQPVAPWLFNLACYALLLAISTVIAWAGWGLVIAHASAWLQLAPPRLATPEGPLETWVRWTLVLVAFDFFNYWLHRANHALPVLWALHRFHHDERHLSAATSLRAHWLSVPLEQVFVLVPVAWLLGLDALQGPVAFALTVLVAVSHMNCDFGLGRLARVIVGPRYHRVHHDRDRQWHARNFANLMPIWDIAFGTFREPVAGGARLPGLEGVPPTASYFRMLMPPVADWRRLLRGCIKDA
jgi:sterol desaturase/sphingolipid hydroxylase (fatty acid hydroxylase superfamily)